MRTAARAAIAGVATVAALSLSVAVVRMARGEAIVAAAGEALESPGWRAKPPSLDAWLAVRNELTEARSLTPADPTLAESLGVLHARRSPSPEFQAYARDYFRTAIEQRPSSPYTWANYAHATYLVGQRGAAFEQSLVNAIRLGPWEPAIHRLGTDLGLAAFNDVQPATRDEIRGLAMRSMHRDPVETLAIAERHGKLDLACAYAENNRRLKDPKWIERCKKAI
jgi:hypothetical protein